MCVKLEYKEIMHCWSVSYSRDKTHKYFAALNGSDSSVTEWAINYLDKYLASSPVYAESHCDNNTVGFKWLVSCQVRIHWPHNL